MTKECKFKVGDEVELDPSSSLYDQYIDDWIPKKQKLIIKKITSSVSGDDFFLYFEVGYQGWFSERFKLVEKKPECKFKIGDEVELDPSSSLNEIWAPSSVKSFGPITGIDLYEDRCYLYFAQDGGWSPERFRLIEKKSKCKFKVGDKVEIDLSLPLNEGYPSMLKGGVITKIKPSKNKGDYLVYFDNYGGWLQDRFKLVVEKEVNNYDGPVGEAIYGFYEEEYPVYSNKWTNELQSAMTVDEANGLVEQIKSLRKIIYDYVDASNKIENEYAQSKEKIKNF